MFIKFSCTSVLLVLLCCWCCVASTQRKVTFSDDAEDEEDKPTTDHRAYCKDRVKNQDETDIDCGGMKCPRCEHMKVCKTNCDCISGTCRDNKCSPSMSCEDKIQNQDESDVDCGGILCPKCTFRKTCTGDCDCNSGVCKDNKCVAGGGCVPACKNNEKCIDNKCSCPTGSGGSSCEAEAHGLCSAKDLADSDPIFTVTFGNGVERYSKKTPQDFHFTTTYKQQFEGRTAVNHFSLVNSIPVDSYGRWHTETKDHTGDQGGYMFFVNGNPQSDEFYRGTAKNLCVGRRYEFSVYLANGCKPNFCTLRSNVKFQVRTTVGNELLVELSSGDVMEHDTLTWKKYGLSFTATSNSVVLLMISNVSGDGRFGNYLAIDDIALRACGKGSGLCPADE